MPKNLIGSCSMIFSGNRKFFNIDIMNEIIRFNRRKKLVPFHNTFVVLVNFLFVCVIC